jgi:hypothetical protein
LVDRPDALGKRSGVRSRELYLKKERDFEMPRKMTLDEAENGLLTALAKVRSARHNQRSGDEAAMAAIRKAHRAPFRESDGLMALLTKRNLMVDKYRVPVPGGTAPMPTPAPTSPGGTVMPPGPASPQPDVRPAPVDSRNRPNVQ